MNWLLKLWCQLQMGPRRVIRINLDEWTALKPGAVIVLSDDSTGHRWAVMHLDDFEHAIDQAKLRLVHKLRETA